MGTPRSHQFGDGPGAAGARRRQFSSPWRKSPSTEIGRDLGVSGGWLPDPDRLLKDERLAARAAFKPRA